MDIYYQLRGITFVWNETKTRQNARKHGIIFEHSAEAFFNPFLKVVDASKNDEERDAIIGMDRNWNLLFVVHIETEENKIRIISSREATRQERLDYENG
ncbi:MAG: BrnT family toxin [Candidatus Omnitrophota bacterium]